MVGYCWILVAAQIGLALPTEVEFVPEQTILKEHIIKKCSLLTVERPVRWFNETLNLTLVFGGERFHGIDEPAETFGIFCYLYIEWYHPCAVWNNSIRWRDIELFGIDAKNSWFPMMTQLNAVNHGGDIIHQLKDSLIYYRKNGKALIFVFSTLFASCTMQLRHIPFDQQDCSIQIEMWEPTTATFIEGVYMTVNNSTFLGPSDLWSLVSFNYSISVKNYGEDKEDYQKVNFNFKLNRRPFLYIYTVFVPCMLITVVLLSAGMLPPKSPKRPLFCITVVLSFSVLQTTISASLPQTATVSYIVIFVASKIVVGGFYTIYSMVICGLSGSKALMRKITLPLTGEVSVIAVLDHTVFSLGSLFVAVFDVIILSAIVNRWELF